MSKNYKKLYEEALERARDLHNNHPLGESPTWMTCEHIFSELKESEDEKIRKAIICGMNNLKRQDIKTFAAIPIDDCIAWLKRQGGKIDVLDDFPTEFERQISHLIASSINKEWEYKKDFVKHTANALLQYAKNELEKQGEQKPVEQDTEVCDLWVYIREWNDNFGRLPKDEDELAACIDYVIKRQKPAEWSEEDEKKKELLISILEVNHPNGHFKVNPINTPNMEVMSTKELVNWLKSLKDKAQPQPTSEWSKEDEEMYNEVLTDIIYTKNDLKTKGCLELSKRAIKAFNWFSKRHKSLRPQSKWKPSEEQMKALNAINIFGELSYVGQGEMLIRLYNDLKNL